METMRYKIHYFRCRYDRWGHEISSSSHTEYADDLAEAMSRAMDISLKFRKHSVNLYDLKGPQEDPEDKLSTTWLVVGYEKGRAYANSEYFKEIRKH